MLKRFILPPLVPLILLILLCVWIVITDSTSPPRIIDGSPDDGPRNASVIMILISPLFYPAFLVLNLIDSVFDHASRWLAGLGAAGLIAAGGVLLSLAFHAPEVDRSIWPLLSSCFAIAAGAVIPMTLTRYIFRARHRRAKATDTRPPGGAKLVKPAPNL